MTGLILFLIIVVLIIWLLAVNIRVVPQAQAYVVEHLGRFKCIWGAGLHLKAPFVEKIVRRVSLKEQVLDFPPQPVITKDNIVLQLDSVGLRPPSLHLRRRRCHGRPSEPDRYHPS